MQNLIIFIRRYFNVFLFVVLEIICLSLVFNHQEYQQTIWLHSSNGLTGKLFQKINSIKQFVHLQKANNVLSQQNVKLLNQNASSFTSPDTAKGIKKDTAGKRQYRYYRAEVVNNSISQVFNYITIHRGRKQGIKPDMGVIGPAGVVGIVRNVSANYAVVMSLLNRKARISALLPRGGNFGTVVWNTSPPNPHFGQLLDIPKNMPVKKGDTVVTSGYSAIFPRGLSIGYVTKVGLPSGSNFYQIDIKLATDFQSLQYVYVIENLNAKEQKGLEKKTENE